MLASCSLATKHRQPLIIPSIEEMIYKKIEEEFKSQNCFISIVNGMPDHVHALFMLNPRISISDTLKHVKGCTSHWIN
jgi:putative transposase